MRTLLDNRERLLARWGRWSADHWGKTLLIGGVITAILTLGIMQLKLEMTFFSIMPGSSSQVQDFKRIIEEFPYASGITIVLDGRHIDDEDQARDRVKEAIDIITTELKGEEFSPYVAEVTGKLDIDYFKRHGLILTEMDDIKRFSQIYGDLNLVPLLTALNSDFEKEYSGQEDNLQDDEEIAVTQFEGLGRLISLLNRTTSGEVITEEDIDSVFEDFLFGEAYFLSRDNRMGLVIVQPTFTMEDLGMLVPGVNLVEETAKQIADDLGLRAGCTGITTVGRDEMVTSEQGLAASMMIALILIMLLMIFAFRMFSVPVISGIPLIIGIYWTLGITGLVIHRLNIMTAMYMVALIGLGIDFAIHLLTTYRQERDGGVDFLTAVEKAFEKSGAGIITGALTTAIAFFALQFAESEIMQELGLVAGLGLIFELLAMMIFIPAFLGMREALGHKEAKLLSSFYIKTTLAGGLGTAVNRYPGLFLGGMLILLIVLSTQAGNVSIENNLMNMEAEGLESVELQDVLEEEFQMGVDGLFILTDNLEEVKTLRTRLEKLGSIKQVDSVGPMLLTADEYKIRKDPVENFKKDLELQQSLNMVDHKRLTEELIRLEMNLLEMADMAFMGNMDKLLHTINRVTGYNIDGEKIRETDLDRLITFMTNNTGVIDELVTFQRLMVPILQNKLKGMSSSDFVELDELPEIYNKSYISQETGDFLIAIIPTQNPWEGDFRDIFTTQLQSVSDRSTGMLLAADQLTEIAEKDGSRAGIVAIIAIFIVLLLDFRNLKLVILTMIPLACAFVSLFGFMGLTGIKFDFINIIAVPLLIGMGVDDAVHISHRYLINGKGSIKETIEYTGTAVLLTTITTVIAFASFIPSIMRAMSSTGIVLSVAMAFAFLYSIILFPALLRLIIDRTNLSIRPWRRV